MSAQVDIGRGEATNAPQTCRPSAADSGTNEEARPERRRELRRRLLPFIVLGNVWLLRNKVDKLQVNVKDMSDYKYAYVIALTDCLRIITQTRILTL